MTLFEFLTASARAGFIATYFRFFSHRIMFFGTDADYVPPLRCPAAFGFEMDHVVSVHVATFVSLASDFPATARFCPSKLKGIDV